jgi:hypothetical protein
LVHPSVLPGSSAVRSASNARSDAAIDALRTVETRYSVSPLVRSVSPLVRIIDVGPSQGALPFFRLLPLLF